MLDISLLKSCKVTRVMNDYTAGATSETGSSVDMNGFDGVMFLAAVGALSSTQVTELKAQSAPDNSTFNDIAGSHTGPLADANSNATLLLDIYRPQQRYVRPVFVRGTANAVIDGIWAIQYSGLRQPTTNDPTTVIATNYLKSPALGTA
jgi:hypothetical protein